jgi:hypothetical protein
MSMSTSSAQPEVTTTSDQDLRTTQPEVMTSDRDLRTTQPEVMASDWDLRTTQPEVISSDRDLLTTSPEMSYAISTSSRNVPSRTTSSATVLICKFEAPYPLSDITEDLRRKIALAVASVLNVDPNLIVVTFFKVDLSLRRRQRMQTQGVLVVVSYKFFQGSTEPSFKQISQDSLNTQMNLLGLIPVKMVSNDFMPGNTQGLYLHGICYHKLLLCLYFTALPLPLLLDVNLV